MGAYEDRIRREFELFLEIGEFPLYDSDTSDVSVNRQDASITEVKFVADRDESGNRATYVEFTFDSRNGHIVDIQRGVQHRGEGIGSDLYRLTERFFAYKGIETVTLNPDDGRRAGFWGSEGFSQQGDNPNDYGKSISKTPTSS